MRATLRRTTGLSLIVAVPVAAGLGTAAPQILSLFGASYAREAATLVRWLALAVPLAIPKELYLARLRVEARMGKLIACSAASSLVTMGLAASLIPRHGIGCIGLSVLAGEALISTAAIWELVVGRRPSGVCSDLDKGQRVSLKVALVCSHGGHLTEMEMLGPALAQHHCFLVTYRSSRTEGLPEPCYLIQNIGTSPRRMLGAFGWACWILWREHPDVILSTGSEIAIPFLWLGRLLGIRTVYIESCCRVTRPSRTGPLVYPVADLFLVQWPSLLVCYGPKAQYVGGLI
jgi:hypothetical protein